MRRLLIPALAVIAVSALLLRCLAAAEPLGIDQGLWASAVRAMSRGQLLYRDVWEQRPPGIYWIYLAGFKTLGWTASTVAWLDVLAAAVTTAAVFGLGLSLAGAIEGSVAAAMYAALTMPAWLYRYDGFLERSVCETFIVPAVALGACCGVSVRERGSWAAAIGLGLCAGAAIVLKPNAGLYLPALMLWIFAYRRQTAARTAPALVLAALAALVIPAIAIAWLWRLGLLHDAKVAVVDFNRFYVAQGFGLADYAVAFSKAVWVRMKTEPLWSAGAIGAVAALWEMARTRRAPALAGLAMIWGAAAALVIVVNGARLYNSYFINAFAPLALIGAWVLAGWTRESSGRRNIAFATMGVMAVLLVQRHYVAKVFDWAGANYQVLRGGIDRAAYLERFGGYATGRGYSARANAELADYVRAHTAADDRIFLFGINGAEVYFASDRLPAHRFLRVNFFVEIDFPDPDFRLESVVATLASVRPRYLIFERLNSPSAMGRAADGLPDSPALQPLLRLYRLETRIEDFSLYRLDTPGE